MDLEGYDQLLQTQIKKMGQWIKEHEFNPDAFEEFYETEIITPEEQWLGDIGFNPDDYQQWQEENPDIVQKVIDAIEEEGIANIPAFSMPSGSDSPTSDSPSDPSDPTKPDDPSDPQEPDSGIPPELRQKLKDLFDWTDEQIDAIFGS
jgi:hypothetical protein